MSNIDTLIDKVVLNEMAPGDVFDFHMSKGNVSQRILNNKVALQELFGDSYDSSKQYNQVDINRKLDSIPYGKFLNIQNMVSENIDGRLFGPTRMELQKAYDKYISTMDKWDAIERIEQDYNVRDVYINKSGKIVEFESYMEGCNSKGKHSKKKVVEGRFKKDEMGLWKYNKSSGYWKLERICDLSTKDDWLKRFEKDEPNESFKLSKNKPSGKPKNESISEMEDGCVDGKRYVGDLNADIVCSEHPYAKVEVINGMIKCSKQESVDDLIDQVVEGVDPSELFESVSLAKVDKQVIDKFVDKESKEGKSLKTNGKKLSLIGLGGGILARWKGEGKDKKVKIAGNVPSTKLEQTIVKYLKKKLPGNWLAESIDSLVYIEVDEGEDEYFLTDTSGEFDDESIEDEFEVDDEVQDRYIQLKGLGYKNIKLKNKTSLNIKIY